MNDDYISRQAAINAIEELNAVSFYELNEHSEEAYKDIKAAIRRIPFAAVYPAGPRKVKCDRCGKLFKSYHLMICPKCNEELMKQVLIDRGKVFPVVRCKDCTHTGKCLIQEAGFHVYLTNDIAADKPFGCLYGIRKDSDG